MRQKKVLDPSIDLAELAELSKNYSGAEIVGLINAASALAFTREIKPDVEVDEKALDNIKVSREDFLYAMKHDVKPALGASEDQLKELALPMIQWDPVVKTVQTEVAGIIKQVCSDEANENRPYYVLFVGEPGSGLTTLAANMAAQAEFPFTRVYQAGVTSGETENAKVQHLKKLFEDASRSELSCIVIDNLDATLDYCRIGPRYSLGSHTVFTSMKDLSLSKGKRMLVICTCRYKQVLSDLPLIEFFDDVIEVPSLRKAEQVATVLAQLYETGESKLTPDQSNELVEELRRIPFKMGIKRVERLIKSLLRDNPNERVKMFLKRMRSLNLIIETDRAELPFRF